MVGERFTKEARQVVLAAVEEARRESAAEVGAVHLLLALLDSPVLAGFSLVRADVEEALAAARRKGGLSEADAEALRGLGIDVDQIVDNIEQSLGEGVLAVVRTKKKRWLFNDHLPFSAAAKQVLVRSLVEAKDLGHGYLGNEHLVLGLLAGGGLAAEVLEARGVTYVAVRKVVSS
ncbi:MAG: Clp protease N-terminal domain-containing protein [Umezawaea sp.]